MNHKRFLLVAGLLTATVIWGCANSAKNAESVSASWKPNFIIIFADDLGYGDLSCTGHPTIHTPNLDRMAAEGMMLTQFYAAASLCTPSRAGLMTGRLPIRSGMCGDGKGPDVLFPYSRDGLPMEEITIAEALQFVGYATACVGKWHLGHLPQFLPTHHGFDSYFGIPYSNDMEVDPEMKVAEDAVFREGMTLEKMRSETPKKNWVPLLRNEEIVEYPADQHTLTKRYTEEAVRFIKNNKDKPFFLYYAQTFPHVPLHASKGFAGSSLRGLYGDVVEELDWSVGQILKTLRENRVDDNTLVIFTSDNGPWLTMKENGGSAGPFRDGKGTTWEGGVREPFIAWWPGRIAAGTVNQSIACTLDLFPTLVGLAGIEMPSDRIYDGQNISHVLLENEKGSRQTFFYYRKNMLMAVRQGSWKMHLMSYDSFSSDSKLTTHDPPLLFNLDQDPGEKYNVANEHPDILEKMKKLADQHQAAVEPVPSHLAKRK